LGFKKIDVEYTPDKRFSGQTKYSYRKMMSLGLDGLTSFSVRPLKFAILLGLIISFIAAIYAIYILYVALFTDNTVKGWTSVILSVLFIGGVNMVLLGIIGEYLGKIFVQVKNRPHYIIRKSNFR
jgi:dolichol-phosphate mannosyltransferase